MTSKSSELPVPAGPVQHMTALVSVITPEALPTVEMAKRPAPLPPTME